MDRSTSWMIMSSLGQFLIGTGKLFASCQNRTPRNTRSVSPSLSRHLCVPYAYSHEQHRVIRTTPPLQSFLYTFQETFETSRLRMVCLKVRTELSLLQRDTVRSPNGILDKLHYMGSLFTATPIARLYKRNETLFWKESSVTKNMVPSL